MIKVISENTNKGNAIFFLINKPTAQNKPAKTADANAAVTQAGRFEK